MQYKKIDINQAIFSNISEETAQEFIDHRLNIKKPLTQGAFNRAVKVAVNCELQLPISAEEAFEITVDKAWVGVTMEYIANELARRNQAAQQAVATAAIQSKSGPRLVSNSTRDTALVEDLSDRSWAQ